MDACARFLLLLLYDLDGTPKLATGITIPCRTQGFMAIHSLGEKLWALQVFENDGFLAFSKVLLDCVTIYRILLFFCGMLSILLLARKACSTRSPAVTRLTGFPPVASTIQAWEDGAKHCPLCRRCAIWEIASWGNSDGTGVVTSLCFSTLGCNSHYQKCTRTRNRALLQLLF